MYSIIIEIHGIITSEHEFETADLAMTMFDGLAEQPGVRLCMFNPDGIVVRANYGLPVGPTFAPVGNC